MKAVDDLVITQTAFADFVMACDSGRLRPWIHHISYRDFRPNWQWTDEDAKRIGNINDGPLTEAQTGAMRKWYQLLSDRRFLVGHIFYLPDHSNRQFVYFDNRDVWQYNTKTTSKAARTSASSIIRGRTGRQNQSGHFPIKSIRHAVPVPI